MERDIRSSAPTWTFVYAAFWGGYNAVMPFVTTEQMHSLTYLILSSLSGAIVVGLGFAVYRRRQTAAWLLVALALIDMAGLIVQGLPILMPFPLLAFSLLAAMYFRKQAKASAA